jgi:membrane fusion protein, multidrug efflux system
MREQRACRRGVRRGVHAAVVMALLVAVSFLASCSGTPGEGDAIKPQARPPVPVLVGKVVEKTIPVEINVIGSGEAYRTVSVKSLVQGEVQQAYFRPGQFVKKGQLLFTIDPEPFKAALAQAQAQLGKDKAVLQYALSQDQRYAALYKEGIISPDQYDQYHSTAASDEATVRADQANIQSAELQLGYCTIRSPVDGLTGALDVDPGNLVKVNDVAMVVINEITPVYVDFSVPQQYLGEIQLERSRGPLRTEAAIPHQPDRTEWGTLVFVNNTVDNTTGTILLKGMFPNADHRLWPGQYVNVTLRLSEVAHAVVAPSTALVQGENGELVYVLKANNTVQAVPVKSGQAVQEDTEITQGLSPGETVVTDGQLMLYPGARVLVKSGL